MRNDVDPGARSGFLPDQEIFAQIWRSPRQVFKFIVENNHRTAVPLLLILGGISNALSRAVTDGRGDTQSLLEILLFSIIVGGLSGWIYYYLLCALVSWTGSWLGGKAGIRGIVRVVAYALIPIGISLFIWALQISVYGIELFKSDGQLLNDSLFNNIFYYVCAVIEIVLVIYAIVFLVIGISEVQKFSIGRAILNLLLPSFLFVGILLLVYLLFGGLW